MSLDIEELNSIPIMDIANRLGIKIHKNKAMCFKGHDHRTPSLSFSPTKNLWHCFGCDLGGNNITLVREYHGYTFKEAIKWLEESYNLSTKPCVNRYTLFSRNTVSVIKTCDDQKQCLSTDHEIYGGFYSQCSLSKKGKDYLVSRGYTLKTIQHFGIRDIINIKDIEKWLLNNFERERLLKSGLMVIRRGGLRLIWWDYTVLFPFFENERIAYLQGRRLESISPKYLGLLGIAKPLYNRNVLINLSPNSPVLICEGITDTLTASQLGFNAVGVLGAASFRKEWVNDLTKFRIMVIPDNDSAGKMFEQKVKNAFQEKGHVIEVIQIKIGKDLSDLLKGVKDAAN
jgi:DNA primase catalytic core